MSLRRLGGTTDQCRQEARRALKQRIPPIDNARRSKFRRHIRFPDEVSISRLREQLHEVLRAFGYEPRGVSLKEGGGVLYRTIADREHGALLREQLHEVLRAFQDPNPRLGGTGR
ncbi:hypothetical protein RSAG8_12500, partial [Rhizoctonia solani AG-8 WAC10335]